MTKMSYIKASRASQISTRMANQAVIRLRPTVPSMLINSRATFSNHISMKNVNYQNNCHIPKPIIMTPTTRFNTNPAVLMTFDQNGGRISKPLMEKRRRARINQCLSQLKMIVVDSARQYTKNNKCKLEKADILELTVNYVKQLHQQQQSACATDLISESYLTGYADCIHQITNYVGDIDMQHMDTEQKESFKDYLTSILAQQQSRQKTCPSTCSTPPSPAPSFDSSLSLSTNISSPGENEIIKSTKNNADNASDNALAKDENDSLDAFGHILMDNSTDVPLNLKIIPDDDVWRPW